MSTTTVVQFVERALKSTAKPYAQIALEARRKLKSQTTPASVRHYASAMRREGIKVKDRPTAREAAFA